MHGLCLVYDWSKIRAKNGIKIRDSNLVKQKLWHMDAYDGAATEQEVENFFSKKCSGWTG